MGGVKHQGWSAEFSTVAPVSKSRDSILSAFWLGEVSVSIEHRRYDNIAILSKGLEIQPEQ